MAETSKPDKKDDDNKGDDAGMMGAAAMPSMGADATPTGNLPAHLRALLARGDTTKGPQRRTIQPRKAPEPRRDTSDLRAEEATDRAAGAARQAVASTPAEDKPAALAALADQVWEAVRRLHAAKGASRTKAAEAGEEPEPSAADIIARGLVTAAEAKGLNVVEADVRKFLTIDELGKGGLAQQNG